MSYVIQYQGLRGHKLYYVNHGWYQDSPNEGGTKVFRTVFLADAMLFADKQVAEEIFEEINWSTSVKCSIEHITDSQLKEARQFKFKEQLAGNYIPTRIG
jgi:hypothetical protein